MKNFRANWILIACCVTTPSAVVAGTIEWNSPPEAMNLESSGSAMSPGFEFELGVFSSGFEPTPSNIAQWTANWHKADTTHRSQVVNAFGSSYMVESNVAPFTAGATGWIMGRKEAATGTEKILFRNDHWSWPAADAPGSPASFPREWSVDEKSQMDQVILGTVTPDGSPILMQSVVVQSYDQWRELYLPDEPLDGPNDAPHGDGVPNLLKYALGLDPNNENGQPSTHVDHVVSGDEKYLEMSVLKHGVSRAHMEVEVSSDLQTWHYGPQSLQIIADKPDEWIVRDKTPFSETGGKRFMRLKVDLPE